MHVAQLSSSLLILCTVSIAYSRIPLLYSVDDEMVGKHWGLRTTDMKGNAGGIDGLSDLSKAADFHFILGILKGRLCDHYVHHQSTYLYTDALKFQ